MYKEYNYGTQKEKVVKLLRKRLTLKDKIRYHKKKVKQFEQGEIPKIEKELNKLLKIANGEV